MVGGEIGPEEEMGEPQVIMTEEARMARNERRSRILNRYAQMAAPGQGMGGGMAAPAAPDMGMDAGAFGGAGISAMTTDPMAADAPVGEDMDAMSEPGDKKPWGTVCPVCGSDDVDVAESKGSCNSCGSTYEIQMSLKLISDGTGGQGEKDEEPEADMGEMGGMGDLGPAAGAPVGGPMGAPAPAAPGAPAPGMPGLPPATASIKGLFRLAATVDADVYLETAKEGFTRTASRRLPIGMVCPKCGNREANKVKDTSFCHSCGNISKTTVAQNKKNPSKLDVTITWID
jgi:ssDNA-binding Zn-finger/Zn-ribbon topoisomerase 1